MIRNKLNFILVLLLSFILAFSSICMATDEVSPVSEETLNSSNETADETVADIPIEDTEGSSEIKDGDLYVFENEFNLDNIIDGNGFIFANNVTINGTINGSLYIFADKVTFLSKAYVTGSVYIVANEVDLQSLVAENDLYIACNDANIQYNTFVYRDLRVLANNLNFAGGVGRNAYVTAKNFNFVKDENLAGLIYGNLTYYSSHDLELSKDFVQGDLSFKKMNVASGDSVKTIILNELFSLLGTLLYTLVTFMLGLWLVPKFVEASSSFVNVKKCATSLGIGVLSSIVAVIASFLLMFSPITSRLSFALLALLFLMCSISFTVVAVCITYKLKEKFKIEQLSNNVLILLGISAVLWILKQIPYVGIFISLIIWFTGLGVILLYLFKRNKTEKKEVKESK